MPSEIFQKLFSSNRGQLRCHNHDYHAPCIYMVTMRKDPTTPRLCEIQDSGIRDFNNKPRPNVITTPFSKIINDSAELIEKTYPQLRIYNKAIMPDHLHILLHIRKYSEFSLGQLISAFKTLCSKQAWNQNLLLQQHSFFSKGFNDLICHRAGQKDAFYQYVNQNHYRYLIRHMYPEYFSKHLTLTIPSFRLKTYGNLFLLDHPLKSVVRFSKDYSDEYWEMLQKQWAETIRQDGVLVSPFIHPEEKDLMTKALDYGTRAIIIRTNGFPERFAPKGRLFEHAAAGRLLLLAPPEYNPMFEKLTRSRAMTANAIARQVAALLSGGYRLSK